ncbi:MAG: hypothetical protein HZB16_18735 [Armatimonadetes bacterium]|nr:hypothetical protein [Armatimonadota bacterium]
MRTRRPAFVTHELLPAIAAVIVFVALLLPVMAAVRDGRLALWTGAALAVALGLALWLPEWLMDRSGRRRFRDQTGADADSETHDDAEGP